MRNSWLCALVYQVVHVAHYVPVAKYLGVRQSQRRFTVPAKEVQAIVQLDRAFTALYWRLVEANQQKVEPILEMVEDLVGCINGSQSVLVFQKEIGGVDSPAEQLQASFLDQRAGELVPPVFQGNGWSARRCDCQKQ